MSDPDAESPSEARRRLERAWGPDFRRVQAIACHLTDRRWHAVADLVREHATSRRTVEEVLDALGPWTERRERAVRARKRAAAQLGAAFGCAGAPARPPGDLYEQWAEEFPEFLDAMAGLVGGAPAPRARLDHVAATPRTCVKRALFLDRNYDLSRSRVLFLGDHDLTSAALAMLRPETEIAIVDVDEDVLAYLSELSAREGWRIRPLFADLRVELPRSVRAWADLAFTDPPYTPEGVELFLCRAVEGLREGATGRVLLCHGFSERHPGLAVKGQAALHELHLALEAMLPRFNRYDGAEAVGSSSALYVCRPTRRTRPASERRLAEPSARIYTRGGEARESAPQPLPEPVLDALQRWAESCEEEPLVVGAGFPECRSTGGPMSLAAYVRSVRGPGGEGGRPALVSLHPHCGGYLGRLPLMASAPRLAVAVGHEALAASGLAEEGTALRRLVEVAYAVGEVRRTAEGCAVVKLARAEAPEGAAGFVLRYVIDHGGARLANAWREGLIGAFARAGRTVTKNEARAAIAGTRTGEVHGESYLTELPLDALRGFVADVEATVATLGEPAGE
jgi:hypothetical protein